MSNWIPTNELRFVERTTEYENINLTTKETTWTSKTVRILQQKWITESFAGFKSKQEEWRDVPVEEEE